MQLRRFVLIGWVWSCAAIGQNYTVKTLAGGALPVNVPGNSVDVGTTCGVAASQSGDFYIALCDFNIVVRWDPRGETLLLFAGNGTAGFSGDNGPATSAQLNGPVGIAVDAGNNVYIADTSNYRVRKVSKGVITTIAGGGATLGDNGPATSAQVSPYKLAVNSTGDLYIAEAGANRVRKVSNGVITTVAGNGMKGFSGDNGPATSAQLNDPSGVAVGSDGSLYISDDFNLRVRKVSNGVITTIAGNGEPGFGCDNCPAISAQLNYASGLALDSASNLYIADGFNYRVRKISNGVITTAASDIGVDFIGSTRFSFFVSDVAVDPLDNLYIADTNHRILQASNGVVTTVVGRKPLTLTFSGDNGPATSARLYQPSGVAVDASGSLYIVDSGNNRIRKVSNGVITTVAGDGSAGSGGDNGPATEAQFNRPYGIATDSSGNLYISDVITGRIRKISNGVITTVAGSGRGGFSGDNGPATKAELDPYGIAVDPDGNVYIADNFNHRVRKVSKGVITTVAGTGDSGFGGDGGPATSAQLYDPVGVAVDSSGSLYIADSGNGRIRKVSNGVITTIAGTGYGLDLGSGGDNLPAVSAGLYAPSGVAFDSSGSLYIADIFRVRKVTNGTITTVVSVPSLAVTVDSTGNVYESDGSSLVRVAIPSCNATVNPASVQTDASGGSLNFSIQIPAGCSWTVSGLPAWINVSTATGTGPATITLTVAPNSDSPRTAAISIAGTSVHITQPASATRPALTGTPSTLQATVGVAFLYQISGTNNPTSYSVRGLPPGLGYDTTSGLISGIPTEAQTAVLSISASNSAGTSDVVTVTMTVSLPPPTVNAFVNAASSALTGSFAPGSIVSAYGIFAGVPAVAAGSSSLPNTLGGLSLQFFDGTKAPLFFVSEDQVNFQVPWNRVAGSQGLISATVNGQAGPSKSISIAQYSPGIFSMNGQGSGQGAILDASYRLVDSSNPARAGIDTIQIYCTGLGPVTNQPSLGAPAKTNPLSHTSTDPAVTIGGAPATVLFSGLAPGTVGEYQVNVQVPSGSSKGAAVPVAIAIGSATSNTVTIAVQ